MQSNTLITGDPYEMADVFIERLKEVRKVELKEVIDPILSRLKYVTSSQAAELIGIKPSTVRTWEKDGRLKAYPTDRNEKYLLTEVLELAEIRADKKARF